MARISIWKETAWTEIDHQAPAHLYASDRRRALRPLRRAEECRNVTLGEFRKNLRRELFGLEERLDELSRRDDALALKMRKFNVQLEDRLNRWDERGKALYARLEMLREELRELSNDASDIDKCRQLKREEGALLGHLGLIRRREEDTPSKIQDFHDWIDERFERLERKVEALSYRHQLVRRMLQGVEGYIREYGLGARIVEVELQDGQLLISLCPRR